MTKLPCGCKHDDARWIVLCAEHGQEVHDVHMRWSAERLAIVKADAARSLDTGASDIDDNEFARANGYGDHEDLL